MEIVFFSCNPIRLQGWFTLHCRKMSLTNPKEQCHKKYIFFFNLKLDHAAFARQCKWWNFRMHLKCTLILMNGPYLDFATLLKFTCAAAVQKKVLVLLVQQCSSLTRWVSRIDNFMFWFNQCIQTVPLIRLFTDWHHENKKGDNWQYRSRTSYDTFRFFVVV